MFGRESQAGRRVFEGTRVGTICKGAGTFTQRNAGAVQMTGSSAFLVKGIKNDLKE